MKKILVIAILAIGLSRAEALMPITGGSLTNDADAHNHFWLNAMFKAGTGFTIADPTDLTKKVQFTVSGVPTGTTRYVNIPGSGNSTEVVPSTAGSHLFVVGYDANGVAVTAQPAITDLQNIATNRLLGRATSGSGTPEQIVVGTGLSLSLVSGIPTLQATGGGGGGGGTGTVTSINASGGTTGLTFSGGPITSAGTLTLGGSLGWAYLTKPGTTLSAFGIVDAQPLDADLTNIAYTGLEAVYRDIAAVSDAGVDNRLVGKTAGSSAQNLFSSRNDTTHVYVRSATWFGGDLDMTATSVWSDEPIITGAPKAVTLIAPDTGISAAHVIPTAGSHYYFVTNANANVILTVASATQVNTSDVAVVKFTSSAPGTITPWPVLTLEQFSNLTVGTAIIYLNQTQKAFIGDTNAAAASLAAPSESNRSPFWADAIIGDSTHPGFIIIDGKAVLIWTLNGPTYGDSVATLYSDVNTAITSLGSSYALTPSTIKTPAAAANYVASITPAPGQIPLVKSSGKLDNSIIPLATPAPLQPSVTTFSDADFGSSSWNSGLLTPAYTSLYQTGTLTADRTVILPGTHSVTPTNTIVTIADQNGSCSATARIIVTKDTTSHRIDGQDTFVLDYPYASVSMAFQNNKWTVVGTDSFITDAKSNLSIKPSVTMVADTNVTLSGVQTIDGTTGVSSQSIVLCAAQTTGSQNGPWVMQSGSWTRPAWWTTGSTTQAIQFCVIFVRTGTLYRGTTWRMTTAPTITIDTTATVWAQTAYSLNSTSVSGSLPITNGGTGLTAAGTANQFTGMNSGATAEEWKSLATGTSGSDFAITHSTGAITFNLPTASASNRGLLSTTDWSTFNNLTAPTYITETATSSLSNEFAMGSLVTGLVKNTTTTGVPSIATPGTDYVAPSTTVNGHALSSNVTVTTGDLGASTVGANIFALTNPSAVTFLRINADNSVSTRSAAQLLADLSGTASADFSMNSHKITSVSTPTASGDATNKGYVDGLSGYVLRADWGAGTGGTLVNPADSTTYYIGAIPTAALTSRQTWARQRMYIPRAGTIVKVVFHLDISSTLGSSESVEHDIRLNDTTDTVLSTTETWSAISNDFVYTPSIAVSIGDYIAFKIVAPAWATNPTGIVGTVTIYIQ